MASASVPQTGRAPGMIYRKSANADSSVLSHPITWLDERIFGWSRSASSSVWGGSSRLDRSRLEPPTAPGSPNDSDGEEYEADVDYDDVSRTPGSLRLANK
jgi:glycerol-3-phosphate O-acyltransferase/dihydroxyacetone phosphate acyltransferase